MKEASWVAPGEGAEGEGAGGRRGAAEVPRGLGQKEGGWAVVCRQCARPAGRRHDGGHLLGGWGDGGGGDSDT